MRIEWECNGEKGGFSCGDGAFYFAGLRLSHNGQVVSMLDVEDLEAKMLEIQGIKCHTVEHLLPNNTVLRVCILSSDAPALRAITRKYAGEVYAEITASGVRVAAVNESQPD